jgi:NDP-sugar pyrophosphorylase family protein
VDSNLMTGQALKEALKHKNTNDKLIIANGDIYY